MKIRILSFKKINFFEADYNYIIRLLTKKGGFLVMPAASSLVKINSHSQYKRALQQSTAALFDSGFFCIILLTIKFIFFKKFSGYKFISFFLDDKNLKRKTILCLDPSIKSANINNLFLRSKKFKFIKNYICPKYSINNIRDKELLNIINKYKPQIILSNIGGGVQEILASYINKNIYYKPMIICSGAALSFFTGEQANITYLVDKYYLGWLKRLFFNPKIYYKRILSSVPLIYMVIQTKINISYK